MANKKWFVVKNEEGLYLRDGEDVIFFENPEDAESFIAAVIVEGTLDMTGVSIVECDEDIQTTENTED